MATRAVGDWNEEGKREAAVRAASRPPARRWWDGARSAPACAGRWLEPTPCSGCAAPGSAAGSTTTGNTATGRRRETSAIIYQD